MLICPQTDRYLASALVSDADQRMAHELQPAGWLSWTVDNDPIRFLIYHFAALQTIPKNFEEGVFSLPNPSATANRINYNSPA
jgi:hypothetical protein